MTVKLIQSTVRDIVRDGISVTIFVTDDNTGTELMSDKITDVKEVYSKLMGVCEAIANTHGVEGLEYLYVDFIDDENNDLLPSKHLLQVFWELNYRITISKDG